MFKSPHSTHPQNLVISLSQEFHSVFALSLRQPVAASPLVLVVTLLLLLAFLRMHTPSKRTFPTSGYGQPLI